MGKGTERFDRAWNWYDRFKNIAEALGIKGWLQSAALVVLTMIWAALIRIFNHLPFWADAALGVILAISCAHLYIALRKAWSLRGLKHLDIKQLGEDCLKFQSDLFDFLIGRQEVSPSREPFGATTSKDMEIQFHESWERGVRFSQQTGARAVQRFAARALALNVLLENAGIKPVDLWSFESEPGSAAAHFGAVGELLAQGLLTEARQINPADTRRLHFSMR